MVDAKDEAKRIIAEFLDKDKKLKPGPHEIHALHLMTLVQAGIQLTLTNHHLGEKLGYKSEVKFRGVSFWCTSKHKIQFD
ncbi:MAG: hypothetical protein ABH837_01725 [bacterium]